MPVSFAFYRADDGSVVDLAEIKGLVHQAVGDKGVGVECDGAFEAVVTLGIVATFRGTWDEISFRQAVGRFPCGVESVARRFLVGEFVFHSWR